MEMLIARENTGHASNLSVDTKYSFARCHSSTHRDQVFDCYATVTNQNFARETLLIGSDHLVKDVVHLLIMNINNNFRFPFQTFIRSRHVFRLRTRAPHFDNIARAKVEIKSLVFNSFDIVQHVVALYLIPYFFPHCCEFCQSRPRFR